jgi:hypothetical protein
MAPLPEGRREVNPSRGRGGRRRGPSFGPRLGVSVPVSFGLPMLIVGLFVLVIALRGDSLVLGVLAVVLAGAGALFLSSGKRL